MAHKQNPSLSCLSQTLVFHLGNHLHIGLSQQHSCCPRRAGEHSQPQWGMDRARTRRRDLSKLMESTGEKQSRKPQASFGLPQQYSKHPSSAAKPQPCQWWFQQLRKLCQPHLRSICRLQALDTGAKGLYSQTLLPTANAGEAVGELCKRWTLRGFNTPTNKMLLSTEEPESFPRYKHPYNCQHGATGQGRA